MTRDGELGWVGTAATGNLDLSTRYVELGNSTRVVKSNLLNTEEVLASWD